MFLCSLNNFDGYYVTRPHKAPKSYVFAVKSTDSLTFFENTADYVHVFASGEGEGKNWLEKILLARVSRTVSAQIIWDPDHAPYSHTSCTKNAMSSPRQQEV